MHRAERLALRKVCQDSGLRFDSEVLEGYRRSNEELWAAYRRGETDTKSLSVERFRRLLASQDAEPSGAAELSVSYLAALSDRGDLLPGARLVLHRLSRRRLAVVTNGIDRVQRRRLAAAGIDRRFHAIVTSEQTGFVKPDPRLVTAALDQLGLAPEQALMVGDDPHSDGAAAERAGVPFCFVDRGAEPNGVKVLWRIRHLGELLEKLSTPPLCLRPRDL